MKKIILSIAFCLFFTSIYAQFTKSENRIKYITTAPDGSIALTITDNINDNKIKLESVNDFYKYQLLDSKTGKLVISSVNRGSECIIDKTKIDAGAYNLKLFTRNFIITSKITLPEPLIAMTDLAVNN